MNPEEVRATYQRAIEAMQRFRDVLRSMTDADREAIIGLDVECRMKGPR